VTQQPELLDGEFKEGAPLTEVAFVGGKFYRDVAVDIDENESCGWGRSRFAGRGEWVGGDGTVGARHGRKAAEDEKEDQWSTDTM